MKRGFTLLEILLVVALIAILAAIVIIAINPSKQLAEARNAQRKADTNTILNAIYQYAIDNKGAIPSSITDIETGICKTSAGDCTGLINLSVLTDNEKYITSVPIDPSVTVGTSTGYKIRKTSNNRITVNAPNAEQGTTISVTR